MNALVNMNAIFNIFMFFSIGGGEIFLILLVVLLFFGSNRIPEIARGLAKGIKEVKHATESIKQEIQNSADLNVDEIVDLKKEVEQGKKLVEQAQDTIKRGSNL